VLAVAHIVLTLGGFIRLVRNGDKNRDGAKGSTTAKNVINVAAISIMPWLRFLKIHQ